MTSPNFPSSWIFGDIEQRKVNASKVLSTVFEVIGLPDSFLDVGGGAGSWCGAAKDLGVQRVCLIDACPPHQVIPELSVHEHVQADLEAGIPSQGFFDLVACIEVIEHISSPSANRLIKQITDCTNLVLFSAAIPGQGGIGHINERLHEYWHDRFAEHSFEKYDIIRPLMLSNSSIPSIYRQNLVVYAKKGFAEFLAGYPSVCEDIELIRTEHLKTLYHRESIDLKTALKAIPSALKKSIKRRITYTS
jgi:hypothetical protein